jgi:hypothetical protein
MNHVSSSLAYVHATAMLSSWPLGTYHSSSSNKCCCCCVLSKEMPAACTTQRGLKFGDWFLNWNPGRAAGDLAHCFFLATEEQIDNAKKGLRMNK